MTLLHKIFAAFLTATSMGVYGIGAHAWNNSESQIQFWNYQSYMSPELESTLAKKYSVQFNNFNHVNTLATQLKLKTADIAVSTIDWTKKLQEQGLLQEIDWSKFNLKTKKADGTEVTVDNAAKALELFTDPVKQILNSNKINNDTLLKYGVPYFIQSLKFIYKGNIIPELHPKKNESKLSWGTLFEKIAANSRFHPKKNLPSLGMIDDSRTLYGIAKLIGGGDDINPKDNENVNDVKNVYKNFINKKINFPVYLNSDSVNLIDNIANPKHHLQGALLYNGDAIFAIDGGNYEFELDQDQIHVVEIDKPIFYLDMMVYGKHVTKSIKNNIHKLIKEISFEGIDNNDFTKTIASKNDEESVGSETKYVHGPMINFDYVQYTPTIKNVYDNLFGLKNTITEVSDSSSSESPVLKLEEDLNYFNLDIKQELQITNKDSHKNLESLNYWFSDLAHNNFYQSSSEDKDDLINVTYDSSAKTLTISLNNIQNNNGNSLVVTTNSNNSAIIVLSDQDSDKSSQIKLSMKTLLKTKRLNFLKFLLYVIEIPKNNYDISKYTEKSVSNETLSNIDIAYNWLKFQW